MAAGSVWDPGSDHFLSFPQWPSCAARVEGQCHMEDTPFPGRQNWNRSTDSRGRGTPSSPEPPCPWGPGVSRGGGTKLVHRFPSVDTTPAVHLPVCISSPVCFGNRLEALWQLRWVLAQPWAHHYCSLAPREKEMKEITCFTLKLRRRTWRGRFAHLLEKTAR